MSAIEQDQSTTAIQTARKIQSPIPAKLMKAFNEMEPSLSHVFLCGGVFVSIASSQKVRDLDFFFADQNTLDAMKKKVMDGEDESKMNIFETDNCFGFKMERMKIQFVKKMFFPDGIVQCIDIFDFRACMWGMTGDQILDPTQGLYSHPNAIFDIAKKELFIMPNHRHPYNVTFRIVKYIKRGWSIKGLSFIRLILQQLIRSKSIKTLGDVKEEIIGIDTLVLAEFFNDTDKFPHETPVEELELRELLNGIDDYFNEWATKQTEFKDDTIEDIE